MLIKASGFFMSYSNRSSRIPSLPKKTQMLYGSSVKSSFYPTPLTTTEDEKRQRRMPMAVLADEVFGIYDDEPGSYAISSDDTLYDTEKLTHTLEQQLELPLTDPCNLLAEYRAGIVRYERAYEKMAANALRWHYLMQEVEDDEMIAQLFDQLQVLRKLSGGDVF